MNNDVIVGSVAGTGANINVTVGFKPSYVKVYNPNDAGALYPTIEWWNGMTAGHGLKTKVIVDSGATGNKSQDKITSGGISQYAGSSSVSEGFTIGTDADINVNGETIFYIAMR